MWVYGLFYYWQVVLVNIIINCVSPQLQFLQEKGCKATLIHTHVKTYECIRVEMYEKNCTTAFYILAALIMCCFDHLLNNKKAAKMKQEDAGGTETP